MHIYVHRCSHFRRCLPTCCFACKTSLRLLLPSNWWCVCAERAREGADQGRESKRAQERERKREPARAKERARSCARKRVSVFEFLDNVMCLALVSRLCVSVRAFRFVRFWFAGRRRWVYLLSGFGYRRLLYIFLCIHTFSSIPTRTHNVTHMCVCAHTFSLPPPLTLSLSLSLSLTHTHREREREREREVHTCGSSCCPAPHMHARTLACAWAH
jgi:hypothetical protein